MPVEFLQQEPSGGSSHATRLVMMYDGSGRRISKTLLTRASDSQGWDTTLVTHYTGIGTEIREYKPRNFVRYTDSAGVEHCVSANPDYGGNASTACPLPDTVKAVIPLPHGLGRYALQDVGQVNENGAPQAFEWYLKNHLGSTMVVYGTGFPDPLGISPEGELRAAYDYRSFGEQIELTSPSTGKVTENFTGKEKDDETQLDYFGARYLDPMLGMWTSVDPARQYQNPYLYAGNNPIMRIDPDGNQDDLGSQVLGIFLRDLEYNTGEALKQTAEELSGELWRLSKDMAAVGATFDSDPESRLFLTLLYGGMSLAEGIYTKDPVEVTIGIIGITANAKTLEGRIGVNLALDLLSLEARHLISTYMKDDGPTMMLPTSGPAPADRTNTSIPYFEE
ncbi:RHS repeat-associated core domain-containing protein [Fibrobacter sp. UWT3]|uniref:RHS repeat-associated core domain-containing protein n=1 Tax=Fibrobacter sp. UWT3 TaxID=1896225 RepID=UPI000BDD1EF8|nr:RHS repeat-associated core domain-containing protein [Fibrobacter sp. UWT3]SOE78411.1 RHS repeat-associated core domain-containing protein [Fibrobacter sp. UWT3]